MNVVEEFRAAIVQPFTDAYAAGRTPNPCIFCNRDFKFGAMLRRARQLDCTHLATGHYARVEQRAGRLPSAARARIVPRTNPTSCTGSAKTSSARWSSRSPR
jgi:tRNA U34 2-thiouridine synthase MnmA/TrmU